MYHSSRTATSLEMQYRQKGLVWLLFIRMVASVVEVMHILDDLDDLVPPFYF